MILFVAFLQKKIFYAFLKNILNNTDMNSFSVAVVDKETQKLNKMCSVNITKATLSFGLITVAAQFFAFMEREYQYKDMEIKALQAKIRESKKFIKDLENDRNEYPLNSEFLNYLLKN